MTLNLVFLKRFSQIISLLLVIGLGVQLAWWGWVFWGTQPAVTSTIPTEPIDPALARQLFGDSADSGEAKTNPSMAAENQSGIRLKGVYAVDGKTLSAAVVNTGGRDTSVRINEKISESVTLAEVNADYIVILRVGVREKIELERGPVSRGNSTAHSSHAAKPAASFRLNVAANSRNTFSLSRGELNTVLQDPRQINFLGSIVPGSNGGVQVNDAAQGTLAQKLGLQVGDIITSINGQPVNGTGDLARFYGQFGSTNSIRAEIKRGGSPMMLVYAINP